MLIQPPMCGSYEPFLQNKRRRFDAQRGYNYLYTYKGLSESQSEALQQSWIQSGCSCELQTGRGISTLDVEDSTQQFTIDSWEVVGNHERRDIFAHPTALAFASPDQIGGLRGHLASNDTPTIAFADTVLSPLGPEMRDFYDLYQRGSDQYQKGQYVLRHKTNAPNRWSANISDTGVDQIYTMAQLLSEVQNTSLWAFPLPSRLVYKLSNLPSPVVQANYQWGWLKGASTETTAANNRVDIVTEYVLEQWSTRLYAQY